MKTSLIWVRSTGIMNRSQREKSSQKMQLDTQTRKYFTFFHVVNYFRLLEVLDGELEMSITINERIERNNWLGYLDMANSSHTLDDSRSDAVSLSSISVANAQRFISTRIPHGENSMHGLMTRFAYIFVEVSQQHYQLGEILEAN